MPPVPDSISTREKEKQLVLYVVVRRAFTNHRRKWRQSGRHKQTWLDHISMRFQYPDLKDEWRWRWRANRDGDRFMETDRRSNLGDDPFANGFRW